MTVDIANRLMQLRRDKGYSQEELADRIGVSRQAVSKWERAESSPDTDNLLLLAQLYDVSVDELLGLCSVKAQPQLDGNTSFAKVDYSFDKNEKFKFAFGNIFSRESGKDKDIAPIVSIMVVIAYLILGFLLGAWGVAWVMFVAIPVLTYIVNAIVNRCNVARFFYHLPYAELVTAVYLSLGMLFNCWHPWWILFVTIPVYHCLANAIIRKAPADSGEQYDIGDTDKVD